MTFEPTPLATYRLQLNASFGFDHLDFVPNHMAVHFADNAWWLDVLEWGPRSPHAASFDIDWSAHLHRRRGRLLLPMAIPSGKARSSFVTTLPKPAFRRGITSIGFRSRLAATPGSCARQSRPRTSAHRPLEAGCSN
jgi:hypothetical protein